MDIVEDIWNIRRGIRIRTYENELEYNTNITPENKKNLEEVLQEELGTSFTVHKKDPMQDLYNEMDLVPFRRPWKRLTVESQRVKLMEFIKSLNISAPSSPNPFPPKHNFFNEV